MMNLTHRYSDALMLYAEDCGLEKIYRQALVFVMNDIGIKEAPEEIRRFIELIPYSREEVLSIIYAFLDSARKKMNLVSAEVFSAVPLTSEQLEKLEAKLVKIVKKRIELTATVDPSLLGGIRVIADNQVLDDTIKRKMNDMRKRIYEGVEQKE